MVKDDQRENNVDSGENDCEKLIGPSATVSLLDQHSRLVKEAEGKKSLKFSWTNNYQGIIIC